MKITLETEEVEAIIEGHVRSLVVLDLTGKIIKTRSSGYSGYEVTIEDPEPADKPIMDLDKAAEIAYGHLDKEEAVV